MTDDREPIDGPESDSPEPDGAELESPTLAPDDEVAAEFGELDGELSGKMRYQALNRQDLPAVFRKINRA